MLLIEVLIALSAVLLCILPLLQPHIAMIQSEHTFTREVQLDRVVNQLFAELLVSDFYNQKIGWEAVSSPRSVLVTSEAVQRLGYQGSYVITHLAPAGGALDESKPFHLLQIQYVFEPALKKEKKLTYTFQLFVQREKKQSAPEGTVDG